jgi:hypothetical protein
MSDFLLTVWLLKEEFHLERKLLGDFWTAKEKNGI